MAMGNTAEGWGWPARLMHWLFGAAIIGAAGLGVYAARLEPDLATQIELTQLHKSIGFTVFFLVLLRLIWRAFNRAPPLPETTPPLLRHAAAASHALLYLLMLGMPLTGWLMASSSPYQDYPGIPNRVFDLFDMPDPFVPGDHDITDVFNALHTGMAVLLTVILVVHVAAALKHHFIDRDRILMRMISGR